MKIAPFSSLLCSSGKSPRFSNYVKKCGFEICSNILKGQSMCALKGKEYQNTYLKLRSFSDDSKYPRFFPACFQREFRIRWKIVQFPVVIFSPPSLNSIYILFYKIPNVNHFFLDFESKVKLGSQISWKIRRKKFCNKGGCCRSLSVLSLEAVSEAVFASILANIQIIWILTRKCKQVCNCDSSECKRGGL